MKLSYLFEGDADFRRLERRKGDGLEDLARYYNAVRRSGGDPVMRSGPGGSIRRQSDKFGGHLSVGLVSRINDFRRLWQVVDMDRNMVEFVAPGFHSSEDPVYVRVGEDGEVSVRRVGQGDGVDEIGQLSDGVRDFIYYYLYGEDFGEQFGGFTLVDEDLFFRELSELYSGYVGSLG